LTSDSDEIRKSAGLPQDDLHLSFEPWTSSIRGAIEAVNQIQRALGNWVEAHREEITAIGEFVRNAARLAAEFAIAAGAASQAFKRTLANMERLARLGWTFPTQLSLAELSLFAELTDSVSAETFMLRKFDESDPQLERMESRFLSDPRLREFSTVLPQCFRAIRREDYAIAVPNLMAILERVIQQLNPPHLAASTDVVRTLHHGGAVARQSEREVLCAAVWLSFATVIADLWKQYPLRMPDSPTLSRPAIQHGRIEAPNSKGEMLRLLNTIETGLSLHDQLSDVDSLKPPTGQDANSEESAILAVLRASFYLPRRG
jgi:hypothetical protein